MNSSSIDFRVEKSIYIVQVTHIHGKVLNPYHSQINYLIKRPLYLGFLQNRPLHYKMNGIGLHWRPQDFWGLRIPWVVVAAGAQGVVLGFYSNIVFPI